MVEESFKYVILIGDISTINRTRRHQTTPSRLFRSLLSHSPGLEGNIPFGPVEGLTVRFSSQTTCGLCAYFQMTRHVHMNQTASWVYNLESPPRVCPLRFQAVVEFALALQEAGCVFVVSECVLASVAAAATSALRIPAIGIGTRPFCIGQVN